MTVAPVAPVLALAVVLCGSSAAAINPPARWLAETVARSQHESVARAVQRARWTRRADRFARDRTQDVFVDCVQKLRDHKDSLCARAHARPPLGAATRPAP